MKQEARRVLLTSKCTVYLPLSMQSPSVNWGTPSTCVTRFSSWHGCVCVCGGGGLTRTLPKAPMATSGGSSIGRAYVPPTCSRSRGKGRGLRYTCTRKEGLSIQYLHKCHCNTPLYSALILHTAHDRRQSDPPTRGYVAELIDADSFLILHYIPHAIQAKATCIQRLHSSGLYTVCYSIFPCTLCQSQPSETHCSNVGEREGPSC